MNNVKPERTIIAANKDDKSNPNRRRNQKIHLNVNDKKEKNAPVIIDKVGEPSTPQSPTVSRRAFDTAWGRMSEYPRDPNYRPMTNVNNEENIVRRLQRFGIVSYSVVLVILLQYFVCILIYIFVGLIASGERKIYTYLSMTLASVSAFLLTMGGRYVPAMTF